MIWASYQATGPVRGWCELMTNKVSLFADRFFETAKAFDPEGLKWDLTVAIRGWWDKEFFATSNFSSSDNKSSEILIIFFADSWKNLCFQEY